MTFWERCPTSVPYKEYADRVSRYRVKHLDEFMDLECNQLCQPPQRVTSTPTTALLGHRVVVCN